VAQIATYGGMNAKTAIKDVARTLGGIPFGEINALTKLIPDLIDAGFEVLNPVQTNAYQMEPERLKKEFGKDVTFWGGGIDTRTVLNIGTPQQVKDQVKRRIEIFNKDGGFVFNTVHNILPDVPPENIMAMIEALRES
jgi:uroporphyrinogen decarboxylase